MSGSWTENYRGPQTRTPDIAPIIREIVALDGWREDDNAIFFILENGIDTLPNQQINFHGYGSDIFPFLPEHLPELIIYSQPIVENDRQWANLYPNPGQGDTRLVFNVVEPRPITLDIYDVAGRLLYTHGQTFSAGRHEVPIAALIASPAGVYLVRLRSEGLEPQTFSWVRMD